MAQKLVSCFFLNVVTRCGSTTAHIFNFIDFLIKSLKKMKQLGNRYLFLCGVYCLALLHNSGTTSSIRWLFSAFPLGTITTGEMCSKNLNFDQFLAFSTFDQSGKADLVVVAAHYGILVPIGKSGPNSAVRPSETPAKVHFLEKTCWICQKCKIQSQRGLSFKPRL